LAEPFRTALYYAPAPEDPLWHLGSAWLGRDAQTGAPLPQPALAGLPEHTAAPRRYGFHATLKAPFTPRHGLAPLVADLTALARTLTPFALPALAVTNLSGFLALCLTEPCLALNALEATLVRGLDHHRLPEGDAARAQRAQGRTPREVAHIVQYGYPLILEDFLFHMTLTAALTPNPYTGAAQTHFAPALTQPRHLTNLALFIQARAGGPFCLASRIPLGA
jgi:hypothetical protein